MTQDEALAIWEYRDGYLYWRENRGKKMKAGDKAGWVYCDRLGLQYRQLEVCGKTYRAHRIIFLMHHGYLPEQIDHIDGNGLNNDIENLRAATNSQNQQNKGAMPKSRVGLKGVSYKKDMHLYRAQINAGGKGYHLGYFPSARQAHEAYKQAAKRLHGEFARFA